MDSGVMPVRPGFPKAITGKQPFAWIILYHGLNGRCEHAVLADKTALPVREFDA